eukprot:s1120_g11.t1
MRSDFTRHTFFDLRAVSEFHNVPGPSVVLEVARIRAAYAVLTTDVPDIQLSNHTKRPGSRVLFPENGMIPFPKDSNPWFSRPIPIMFDCLTHIHFSPPRVRGIGNIWSMPATVQSLKFLLLWQTASDFPTEKSMVLETKTSPESC